jgi:hypothetical protein
MFKNIFESQYSEEKEKTPRFMFDLILQTYRNEEIISMPELQSFLNKSVSEGTVEQSEADEIWKRV